MRLLEVNQPEAESGKNRNPLGAETPADHQPPPVLPRPEDTPRAQAANPLIEWSLAVARIPGPASRPQHPAAASSAVGAPALVLGGGSRAKWCYCGHGASLHAPTGLRRPCLACGCWSFRSVALRVSW